MPNLSRTRRLGLVVALGVLLLPACGGDESSTERTAEPTRAEMTSALQEHARIISAFDTVRAILVARGGETVLEEYYGTADAESYWGLQSVTKSVVSTLVGIALDEGLIDGVDATLAELLPDHVEVMPPAVRSTTLHQLLTMTAGFPAELGPSDPKTALEIHWVRTILADPATPPGAGFVYSNGTSHLLAAIVEEATGESVLDFARSRRFDPLGIDSTPAFQAVPTAESLKQLDEADFAWPVDPQGTNTGWFGLRLRPQDLLKIGQLFLDHGRWEGRQVVSREWVAEATKQQVEVDSSGEGYGYQWWTGELDGDRSYRAVGYGGELIVVVPTRELVVVAATEFRQGDVTSQGIAEEVLLAILEDAVISRFGPL